MRGRNYEQERARTSPNFFSVMWLSGNEKCEHCSQALSPENWPCSRNAVECWAGYVQPDKARAAPASRAAAAVGEWNGVLCSALISPQGLGMSWWCQRHRAKPSRDIGLRMRSSVGRTHRDGQVAWQRRRKGVLKTTWALSAHPLPNSRKHRKNCCCLPREFRWDYSLRLGQLIHVQQVLNSVLFRASGPSCSSTCRIVQQWLDVHHQTLQYCEAQ